MKKYVLGEIIEMSAEEVEAMQSEMARLEEEEKHRQPTTEERLDALESALLEMSSASQAAPENPMRGNLID